MTACLTNNALYDSVTAVINIQIFSVYAMTEPLNLSASFPSLNVSSYCLQ
jgi:hypothetical protein